MIRKFTEETKPKVEWQDCEFGGPHDVEEDLSPLHYKGVCLRRHLDEADTDYIFRMRELLQST